MMLKKLTEKRGIIWSALKSPRTIALLKLGAAIVGVIHAVDELVSSSPGKKQIGFHDEE